MTLVAVEIRSTLGVSSYFVTGRNAVIYKLVRALVRLESGRDCRSCTEPIARSDAFGLSEEVCGPCRT